MRQSREIPLPTAIAIVVVVAVVIIAIGWYMINRNPAPPPQQPGIPQTTAPVATPGGGSVQGETGAPTAY